MNNNSNTRIEKLFIIIGALLILVGIAANQWILIKLFSPDGIIGHSAKVTIWLFDILLIGWGATTIVYRRKEFVRNVNLILASCALALMALESYLRIHDHFQDKETQRLRISDPYLHHTLSKNTDVMFGGGDMRKHYFTNSLGFRDSSVREVPRVSTASQRILFLGDSFTEGVGVEYAESYVGSMHNVFLKNEKKDVEILDAGVNSYSPSLEYRKLKQFLDAGYKTDRVVLMLDISDIVDEGVHYYTPDGESVYLGDKEVVANKNQSSWYRSTLQWDLYPKIFAWGAILLQQFRDSRSGDYWAKPIKSPAGRWTEGDSIKQEWVQRGLRITQENLLRIRNLARENRIRFSLGIYPWPTQLVSSQRPSPEETIFGDFAKNHGIEFFDLYPMFFALGNHWRDYYIRGDIHWNPKGHALVVKHLYDRLTPK